MTNESYGALKALCEEAARDVFRERALVVRPGLIVGPHDPTGRFTYWPHRVARGGEVVAPAPPDRRTQVIDVRDLGEWLVELCERRSSGTFNATHPGLMWSELLDSCRAVSGSDADVTWVPDEFLLEHEVGQWMELPLWLADPELAAADDVSVRRALDAGLTFRPLDETVRGALEHAQTTEAAGSLPSERRSYWRRGMAASKDYSGTPLSQKLGAKPGAGVVVFFTTSREDLERRFESLKGSARPRGRAVDRVAEEGCQDRGRSHLRGRAGDRPRARARRQQELLDRRALAGAPLRLPAYRSAMKSWALRARSQGSSSQRIMSGSTPRASARSHVSS